MLAIDNLPELIRKVEKLKERKQKSQGALDELLKRLKKEFGCSSIKEAKDMLEMKSEEERKAARKYTKMKRRFEKKWEGVL